MIIDELKKTGFVVFNRDCIEGMRQLPDCCIDSVVTDPPYGIRFMGMAWDGADIEARTSNRRNQSSSDAKTGPRGGHKSIAAEAGKYNLAPEGMRAFQQFSEDWAREALRVLKPGGHLLAFSSPRTYHRMTAGIEDAGFEIRDQIMWVFGSGFPKSKNLSGEKIGWGTALKPAHEPIVVARKPLAGTVEKNVYQFGTGAMNIDACRVAPTGERLGGGDEVGKVSKPDGWARSWMDDPDHVARHSAKISANVDKASALGRWPANLIHDGSKNVVDLFPAQAGAAAAVKGTESSLASVGKITGQRGRVPGAFHADIGSAARFFYCAKTTREDRNEGLFSDDHPLLQAQSTMRDCELADWTKRNGNHHPTVKPTDLMAYLCRLVTPPGGVVLDPFTGSGSTGKAAVREGFLFAGYEIDKSYHEIATDRINYELVRVKQLELL